jgi:hypothetical protein
VVDAGEMWVIPRRPWNQVGANGHKPQSVLAFGFRLAKLFQDAHDGTSLSARR